MFNVYIGIDGRRAVLPQHVDPCGLIDITQLHQTYRVFVDPETGAIHDGNVYAKQLEKDQQQ